eukprot:gene20658-24761_t
MSPGATKLGCPCGMLRGSDEPLCHFCPKRKSPFDHLIYPLPEDAGLGVHATNDLGGQVRFGPDVEWIPEVNYTVDPGRSVSFESAIRKWWPGLLAGSLQPAYSGIRPK